MPKKIRELKSLLNKAGFTVKYTIVIQWSNEDNCFVVFLPEFETMMQPVTHGETYEEAFQNAQQVLALLTESDDQPLPNPKPLLFVA